MLISYCSFVLLSVALAADTFAAGLSYSAGKVRVPLSSVCVLSLISGLTFTLSLTAGKKIAVLIPPKATAIFSFFVLLILALYKLYDALPDKFHPTKDLTTISFSKQVNKKEPSVLSPAEALVLSLALSIDSITAGIGSSGPDLSPAIIFVTCFVIHFFSIALGLFAGKKLLCKKSCHLSFLPAVLLFLLALSKLF